ncbi:MAG: AAA family ATPase, partial [Helicobacter sp.]|nr:AAA family ATPase [Helicobacter sp.]
MIQKITIENFKVFDFIEIEGFSQINVFVGANDSGKTSLLEAIFLSLAPSNPDLLFRT